MQTAISITTINVPTVLDGLTKNIVEHGHTRDTRIIITGDRKTPVSAEHYCREVAGATGLDITYMALEDQLIYLDQFRELRDYLPENSLGRRNVGNLLGYESGADVIIMLDDDNECIEQTGDFVGRHCMRLAACQRGGDAAQSCVEWFNALDHFHGGRNLTARGWPHGVEPGYGGPAGRLPQADFRGRSSVSQSFCLGEADIDATHRLRHPSGGHMFNGGGTYCLRPGVWHPINTQATAFHRDIMPAAFVNPHLKRYDDIWMGYVVRAVSDMMGWGCSFGEPVVGHFQWRTRASVLRDLGDELEGMERTPAFVAKLEQWKGHVAAHHQDVSWLSDHLLGYIEKRFPEVAKGMQVWLTTLDRL